MKRHTRNIEESLSTRIVEEADVVVAGAGPAGVAAAVAAARSGARTRLLESHGSIGGIWTSGLLTFINDCGLRVGRKAGLMMEIIDRMEERGAGRRVRDNSFICDGEQLKLLLEDMCIDADVRVQLHTHVVATSVQDDRLRYAITESKAGRQAWGASVFVDATGDGDLSALAGCSFDLGHPDTGRTQPFSLIAVIAGPDPSEVRQYLVSGKRLPRHRTREFRAELERSGVSPSYTSPCLWHYADRLYVLMANHEYGYRGTDPDDVTRATFHARHELDRLVKALRAMGGPWKDARIVSTAEQIGVREGRRIHGIYSVTKEDMIAGVRHDDGVCRVDFPIDIHALDPEVGKGHDPDDKIRIQPYDVPLRALIARDIRALMVAGRCISGDFWAHASYRQSGDAVRLGQAAGITAGLAALSHTLPERVPANEVLAKLHDTRPAGQLNRRGGDS
jgi:hypothetical protein